MCVLTFAWQVLPDRPLLFAGNRDEFHARPTTHLADWAPELPIVAGRDIESGGTWLGLSPSGRFAVVTNFREPDPRPADGPSRGSLVVAALLVEDPEGMRAQLRRERDAFAGFNLIFGDREHLFYVSNRDGDHDLELEPGVYGLSNHTLDTPWPKVRRLRDTMERSITTGVDEDALFDALADTRRPDDTDLPDTGVGESLERLLSPAFIVSPEYGTRASTLVSLCSDGRNRIIERGFAPDGTRVSEHEIEFRTGPAA